MTKSTIDDQSGDGGFDIGSSVDDLFGDIADESDENEPVDRETDDVGSGFGGGDTDDDDGIEDQTAANVFGELKDDVETETDGADEVLGSETPEDIIASADEPIREPESPIDDLLASKEELADLLLTGRTKEEEFLWVETESDGEPDADAAADPDAATNPDREINPDAEPASDEETNANADADEPNSNAESASASDQESAPEIVSDTSDDADTSAGIEDDPRDIEQIIEDRSSELDDGEGRSPSSNRTQSDDGETDGAPVASSSGASGSGSADAANSTDDERSGSTADEKPTGLVGLLRSLLGGFL